ncbi:MAG: porin [Saprospiraceae bacterium]|nr:porin [Saprospiraceae bacterium]
MIKRLVVEFIGSFFISLVVCMTAYSANPQFAALASGFVLAGLMYASGHLSGAHFNPAVSIAVFLRGKMNLNVVPMYILSQCAGSIVAAIIALLLISNQTITPIHLESKPLEGILAEFIGTFAIVYVLLNVATSKVTLGNDYYGIAIGLTLTACSFALGGVSGAAFNPAVSLAICFSKISTFSNLWIYWVGEILGGVLAAVVFLFLNGKE